MAKKQAANVPPVPAAGREGFVSVINLKGSSALKAWLSSASKETHIPAAAIVRLGLANWAKQLGRPAPPEK